jgi:hypothetical protein
MPPKLIAAVAVAASLLGACTSSPSSAGSSSTAASPTPSGSAAPSPSPSASAYHPVIDPANFVEVVDNPYFPLTPGTTYVFEGVRDGRGQRDEFEVTGGTKVVLGVTSVVVRDTATRIADGSLIERTDDWFAQDKDGNVWYMGEDTKTFDAMGNVKSTEGSWEAGVDGALPGIVMPSNPEVLAAYRQEYYPGQAEDMAWLVSLDQSVNVPYRSFGHVLETLEWSPLEPDVVEKKYYASGIGLIFSTSAAGEVENARLVAIGTS